MACGLAFSERPLAPIALAEICRDAEHEARGVPTGLLDQLASICAVEGHGLLIDCATNATTPIELPSAEEIAWIVIDTGRRSLADSGYAARVAECAAIEAQIGPLRDADLTDVAGLTDPTLRRRARHVVTENARVHEFIEAITSGDLVAAGDAMDRSHRSLRDDYESSAPAADQLCEQLGRNPGVLGARITGGGWGGCVVVLARSTTVLADGWRVTPSAGALLLEPDG